MILQATTFEKQFRSSHHDIANAVRNKDITYKNKVIVKPWGYEYLVYESTKCAIWVLHINTSQSTSVHCHFKKDTILINLNGAVTVNLIDKEKFELPLMDFAFIPKDKFHGFTSIHNAVLLEIEIFHNDLTFSDKNDLLRLIDIYDRETTGYETSIQALGDEASLKKYGIFFLEGKPSYHTILNTPVALFTSKSVANSHYNIVLNGCYVDSVHGCILKEGSILDTTKTYYPLSEDCMILHIERNCIKEDKKCVYSHEQLEMIVSSLKKNNKKIVLTSGCFDILHAGHLHNLKNAKLLGDVLMVCVSNDEQIKALKGHDRPINTYRERLDALKYLPYIDYLVTYSEGDIANESSLDTIMQIVTPDVWAKGNDYNEEDIRKLHPSLQNIVLIPNLENKSTTNIILRARQ
jgi:rfaE bifunctional protein nucleotidyltransferase chain/domain